MHAKHIKPASDRQHFFLQHRPLSALHCGHKYFSQASHCSRQQFSQMGRPQAQAFKFSVAHALQYSAQSLVEQATNLHSGQSVPLQPTHTRTPSISR